MTSKIVLRLLFVFLLLVSISLPCRGLLPISKYRAWSLGSSSVSLRSLLPRTNAEAAPAISVSAINRRDSLSQGLKNLLLLGVTSSTLLPQRAAAASETDLSALRQDVQQALRQLNDVPNMIQAEQWDAVRTLLVTPPFSVFRKAGAPWWQNYGDAVEANGGDEFQVLELKEELQGHLQSLDMAVYNNIFNPIKTQGETGATKQLVQSYYEDPIRAYKATKAALDELARIGLGSS